MSKTIIGFAGRKRAGKTCLSKYLTEKYNGTIVTVADALKHLCCDLCGFKDVEELNFYKDKCTSWSFNKVKEAPQWAKIICEQVFGEYTDEQYSEIVELLNGIYTYNVRELLQFIGTDIIRKYKPNWHVEKMVEAINNAPTDLVCVDDVRFPNERNAIEDLGGTVFFIIRPDLSVDVSNHESEISLEWQDFNSKRVILNMFDLDYLFTKFDEAYQDDFAFCAEPIFQNGDVDFNYINPNFARKSATTDPEIIEFIKNIVISSVQTHNGAIILHVHGTPLIRKYNKMIVGHDIWVPLRETHTFNLWNPYIIENLKAWL